MDISEQVFLLSGCASGIGAHLCDEILAAGGRLIATDVNIEALEARAQERSWEEERAVCASLDVRDPAAWRQVLEEGKARFERVDVVMNIAGYLKPGWCLELGDDDVDRHIDINTKGLIHGTRAAAALMKAQGGGHIINIASLAALTPVPGLSLYSASKFAVRSFSLSVAEELKTHGIAVTVVCPDAVQTPMLDLQKSDERAALTFSGSRVLTVEDIGRCVLGPVLKRRPLEVQLPRARAALALVGSVFPKLMARIGPHLSRKGRKLQQKLLAEEP